MDAALEALNSDPPTHRRTRFADVEFVIRAAPDEWRLALRNGSVVDGAADAAPAFEIVIDPEAWAEFKRAVPRPGYHDLAALAEGRHARVTGDFLPMFRYFFVIKDILSLLGRGRLYG